MAGVTGKISGRITDASTGEPLVGVNMLLENTSQGAATDSRGNYTILNVHGGKYTLVATMIGYKRLEMVDVTVLADRTTWIDLQMEQTAIGRGRSDHHRHPAAHCPGSDCHHQHRSG